MSYGLLFAGQAGQHAAMLPWLEAEPACQPMLAAMAARIGADWRDSLADETGRSANAFAQQLITGTCLAAWDALRPHLPAPAMVAGYSVGELAAFACAGVLTNGQALALASQRAALMDQAVAGRHTGLLSIAGLPEAAVLAACPQLECAIRLHAGQAVYAGSDASLLDASQRLAAAGAVCKRLPIQLASHSSWMRPAAQAFAELLQGQPFARPVCPVALNALGVASRDPAVLRQALGQQIASSVQWSACLEAMMERQVSCVLEVGPGSALARMWNERYPAIPARSLDEFQHLQGALDWLHKHTGD